MSEKKELSKEEKIQKEFNRIKRQLKGLDKNKLETARTLIERAAFMTVSLQEIEVKINAGDYVVEYKNGENQFGTKKSPEVDLHISMTKNLNSVMKLLLEITPVQEDDDEFNFSRNR